MITLGAKNHRQRKEPYGSSAARFARAIRDRYRVRPGQPGRSQRVWRSLHSIVNVQNTYHFTTQFAPRLSFVVLSRREPEPPGARQSPSFRRPFTQEAFAIPPDLRSAGPVAHPTSFREELRAAAAPRQPIRTLSEPIYQRLSRRSRRVEPGPGREVWDGLEPARGQPSPGFQPLRRTLQRLPSAGTPTISGQAQAVQVSQAVQARPPALPSEAPLPDINHLADQVIQTIDRRITARLERLGRV